MSKIQVPTGEVIVRSNSKKRFIMVEDKYQFDDDTWGLIKEFMGIDRNLFKHSIEEIEEQVKGVKGIKRRQNLLQSEMSEFINYLLQEKLSFYANRFIQREDIKEKGLDLVGRMVYSMGTNLIAKNVPTHIIVREVYSYITLVVQDIKFYLIHKTEMYVPWLYLTKLSCFKVNQVSDWVSETERALINFKLMVQPFESEIKLLMDNLTEFELMDCLKIRDKENTIKRYERQWDKIDYCPVKGHSLVK